MGEFQVTKTETFEEGWGADFTPIWAGGEDERISDVDGTVFRISEDATKIIGGVACAVGDENYHVPLKNFQKLEDLPYDDQHDLRARWFATEEEALDHVAYTLTRWANPQPWESFVTL